MTQSPDEGPKVAQIPIPVAGIAIPARLPRVTTVNCCNATFTGMNTCHCTSCHATFTGITAFDKHRTGSHPLDTRHCLDPAILTDKDGALVFADSGRSYPCWSIAGNDDRWIEASA